MNKNYNDKESFKSSYKLTDNSDLKMFCSSEKELGIYAEFFE